MTLRAIAARFPIVIVCIAIAGLTVAHGATNGRIDPNNKGQHYAQFLNNPGIDVQTDDLRINFGKFTTQSDRNIRISEDGLTGYAWGALSGWIVMNCVDTASGCSAANGNFKVSVTDEGLLQGYAWGENTGWINFGPFTNPSISRVQIDDKGFFDGATAAAGYAWSEQFGWIYFDCDIGNDSCVRTDYTLVANTPVTGSTGSVTQCGDLVDNDGDGSVDMQDPQCGNGSVSEFVPYSPVDPSLGPAPVTLVPTPTPVPPSTPWFPGTNPINPTTPVIPGDDPFIPFPEQPTTIIGEVVPIVTDVITGKTTGAEAWERFKDMLRELINWVKDLFDIITGAIEQLMKGARTREFMSDLSVLGLGLLIGAALLITAIIPLAAGADLFLYPVFVMRNILTALGIFPAVKPWGIIYGTDTFQPLPFAPVSLVDASGKTVATTLSQPDGSFAFRAPSGLYTIGFGGVGSLTTIDSAALTLFGPLYIPGETIGVADNIPSHGFSIGIAGQQQPTLTLLERFMVDHEVLITNVSLALFGMGLLASVLSVIFAPTAFSIGIAATYIVVIILRSAGAVGSYASVFMDRITGLPAAGKLVQVFDVESKTEVTRTLTSRLGRAYFNIPRGHYYNVVSDPKLAGAPGAGTVTDTYVAHGGLHRAHIEI